MQKILYVIVEFKTFIKDPKTVLSVQKGFVVWWNYCRLFDSNCILQNQEALAFLEYFDLAVASAFRWHNRFGRMDVFLQDAAMEGRQPSRFGGLLPEVWLARAGVKTVPQQLISSWRAISLIMIVLLLYYRKNKKILVTGKRRLFI